MAKENTQALDKEQSEAYLASLWHMNFKNAMVHKLPYTKRWLTYMDAYKGDYFKNQNLPEYKSDMVSNYIFSIIETVRPIMLDNNPKFQSMARQPEGLPFSNDVQESLMYEWDREKVNKKLYRELINTLVYGTSVFFIPWDAEAKEVRAIPVNPFNIFPDPLATCVEDAEYIIYAKYEHVERLKKLFPKKADALHGSQINYSELVQDNDKNARIDNQVLVLEVWCTDYEVMHEEKNGVVTSKRRYPNGRVLTICPELGIVLKDIPAPYQDKGRFPFVLFKDYDIPGKFWGEGEVQQLLSPQKHMNDLNNAIIDNAKATANMPWIIDNNAGIGVGKITARPGLIIRKNPGTEVRREQPPNMPQYVINAIETYKTDIEQISGVSRTLRGENESGVYTAQGILALQEASQSRIRLKVTLLELSLGEMAEMWFSRMKQFWTDERWIRVTKFDGTYDIKKFRSKALEYDYDISISAGSTMPVNRGAMLDLMIRLAQTPMPDGQMLVDREAVAEFLPPEIKAALLQRMQSHQTTMQQLQSSIEELGMALKQLAEESNANDEKTFSVIEDITETIEDLSNKILQLQQKHDKMEQEQAEKEKEDKIKREAYNKGFQDAEELYTEENENIKLPENPDALPDDILDSLSNMSDEELAELLQTNPEIEQLLEL